MLKDILSTNFNELFLVAERAIFSLVTLFLITKIIGKKQMSELTLFDYTISISIGNFAAEITTNTDVQILNGFLAVLIFGFIYIVVAYLGVDSLKIRKFFNGTPTIIINNGKFMYDNFKRLKIDMNDFLQSCRLKGYFDISKIKYAIMEANGSISFLLYEKYDNVINSDMKLKPSSNDLLINVIIDGKILKDNLKYTNKDIKWLKEKLKDKDVNKILLATLDSKDKLSIYYK